MNANQIIRRPLVTEKSTTMRETGADMKDKANWPNDYNARWNYLSYFPARMTSAPLFPADIKLGAAGMSIDKAWTYTIGRDDVHIDERQRVRAVRSAV